MIRLRALPALLAASLLTVPAAPPALAQVSAINLPSLGEVAGAELSSTMERKLGEQIMLEVRRDSSYLPDPETVEYLNKLGYRLVAVSPSRALDFVFFPIRDSMLNAFALPGGFIGVHSGLVISAQSESELASVIGHEIGHVTQRHIARMIERQKDSTAIAIGSLLLAILAARAGGSSNGDLAQAAIFGGQAAAIQQQLNFSREAEREADRVGFLTLQDAGYDVRGMESFFTRLQQGTRIYESAAPAYLRTHPLTVERISDIQNRTRGIPVRQRADSLDFRLVQARLRVLQETSHQGWREQLEYFQGQLKNRTTTLPAAAHYGASVAALKLGQTTLAADEAAAARKLTTEPSAMLDKLVAETRYAAAKTPADKQEALRLALEAANRFPLSTMTARAYVDMLHDAGLHQPVVDYLRDQQAIARTDPNFHGLLGRAYAGLGKQSLHHQAVGEMYALMGAKVPAVQQFEQARRANDGDFFTMSEIDARLRFLREEVRREHDELMGNTKPTEPNQRPSEPTPARP